MVLSGWNVVVSGGTSSGKTTLLNALAGAIPPDERIVTIEETAELQLAHPHVVRLESRPAGAEGVGAVGLRDLVRTALRMRPDRIVVGEVRGAEAYDMLQACNTGHNGSLSTLHANTAHDALVRLEALANMAGVPGSSRSHIRSGIDAVIQVARTRTGARRITEIAALGGTSRELQMIVLSKPTMDGCDAVGPLPTRAGRNGG
jgi:pilus assembly protein CpaF